MKSSSGQHYLALDHLRAFATFLVFSWHFMHTDGALVPLLFTPAFPPLALLEEGHVGVGLFMTLSGYLFAKLLDGKTIDYPAFLAARFMRLAPLLVVVFVIVGVRNVVVGEDLGRYVRDLATGLVLPTWPSGAWSITVEAHFYIVLPFLLWLSSRDSRWLLAVLACSLLLRSGIYLETAEAKTVGYSTIVGRIDQFVLGILVFQRRDILAGRHARAGITFAVFSVLTWTFDLAGGNTAAPQPLWIIWPLVEAVGWATLIAWYDNSVRLPNTGASKFLALIGTYSYSIYLLHFFVVYHVSRFIHRHVMDISNFYVAIPWAVACFLAMVPIGYLSFRFIESPFLRRRIKYVREGPSHTGQASISTAR